MGMRDHYLKKKKEQDARMKNIADLEQAKINAYTVENVKDMFDLEGHDECYIVGGGPSLKNFNWDCLKGKFVIAINRAYEVLPDADIVYFTDKDFWQRHKEGLKKHKGKLFRGTQKMGEIKDPKITEFGLTGETGLDQSPGKLRHGRNSTYAAINLAGLHLGFKRIYLLGIDMKWGKAKDKSTSHWHSGHRRVDSEPVFNIMKRNFMKVAPLLQNFKIEVINVNDQTSLKAFPVVGFEQVFGPNWNK